VLFFVFINIAVFRNDRRSFSKIQQFLLYSFRIYPTLTGKRRWQCALDAPGIYTIIKVFSSQRLVNVTKKICQELCLIYGNPTIAMRLVTLKRRKRSAAGTESTGLKGRMQSTLVG